VAERRDEDAAVDPDRRDVTAHCLKAETARAAEHERLHRLVHGECGHGIVHPLVVATGTHLPDAHPYRRRPTGRTPRSWRKVPTLPPIGSLLGSRRCGQAFAETLPATLPVTSHSRVAAPRMGQHIHRAGEGLATRLPNRGLDDRTSVDKPCLDVGKPVGKPSRTRARRPFNDWQARWQPSVLQPQARTGAGKPLDKGAGKVGKYPDARQSDMRRSRCQRLGFRHPDRSVTHPVRCRASRRCWSSRRSARLVHPCGRRSVRGDGFVVSEAVQDIDPRGVGEVVTVEREIVDDGERWTYPLPRRGYGRLPMALQSAST
jgi:hypothetical protein